jgi:hypothetical protein
VLEKTVSKKQLQMLPNRETPTYESTRYSSMGNQCSMATTECCWWYLQAGDTEESMKGRNSPVERNLLG